MLTELMVLCVQLHKLLNLVIVQGMLRESTLQLRVGVLMFVLSACPKFNQQINIM
jgi:hypothetical protein